MTNHLIRGRRIALAMCATLAAALVGGYVPSSETSPLAASAASPHLRTLGGARPVDVRPTYKVTSQTVARQQATIARLPLSFEVNQGQVDSRIKFSAHGTGSNLYLTNADAVLTLAPSLTAPSQRSTGQAQRRAVGVSPQSGAVLNFHLVGSSAHPKVVGLDRLSGTANYFIGTNPRQWHTNIATYAKVAYVSVYPKVDLVYYGNQGQLEYDFVLRPGANPQGIRFSIVGADQLRLDARGNLLITANGRVIRQNSPVIYQEVSGRKLLIGGRFVLLGHGQVGFDVNAYNIHRTLVIDPVLVFSTFFAGGAATTTNFALDGADNIYLTGYTDPQIAALPAINPLQPTPGGEPVDIFVAKLNPSASKVLFSTYLGGSSGDQANGMALDRAGNVYLTGTTSSGNFPTTLHSVQPHLIGATDAFIAKLSADGHHLLYSTYLGGATDNANAAGTNGGSGIAVDSAGNAYITGYTYGYNFPLQRPFQRVLGFGKGTLGAQVDALVTKINSSGTALLYSTYLGGSGSDEGTAIKVDHTGSAYIVGWTNSPDFPIAPHALQNTLSSGSQVPFVAKLNPRGDALLYSTFLGTSVGDVISSLALDQFDNLYLTGQTNGGIPKTIGVVQPTSGGGVDAFVTKMDPRGVLVYSTYLGGSGDDIATGIALDGADNVYIAGTTASAEFNTPVFPLKSALQGTLGGNRGGFGMQDAYLVKMSSCGTALLYSSYLGGTFADGATAIAVDRNGAAYMTGSTLSPNFPLKHPLPGAFNPAGQAFVAKISASLNQPSGKACPPPLIASLSATQVMSGSALTVTVQTAPGAVAAATLVITQPVPAAGPVVQGTPKAGTVLYRVRVQGVANGYGQYTGVLHIAYGKLAAPMPALVTVRVQTAAGRAATTAAVTISP